MMVSNAALCCMEGAVNLIEMAGLYNRLELVGEYFVFYHHEGEWIDTSRPEYVTGESIEELLATGKLYNDFMFVLSH